MIHVRTDLKIEIHTYLNHLDATAINPPPGHKHPALIQPICKILREIVRLSDTHLHGHQIYTGMISQHILLDLLARVYVTNDFL